MSGIIGGAGSKSGVIGTTELDYEEGDWTPTLHKDDQSTNEFNGNTTGHGLTLENAKYTKIGNMVYCTFVMIDFDSGFFPSTSAGNSVTISGLPFERHYASVNRWHSGGVGGSNNYYNMTVMLDNYAYDRFNWVTGTTTYFSWANLTRYSTTRLYADIHYLTT